MKNIKELRDMKGQATNRRQKYAWPKRENKLR